MTRSSSNHQRHSPGNYRRWLQSGNCTICARRCHLVFEIRKGFDNQIAELQQGADLILQFLERFGLIGMVMKVLDEVIEVIVRSEGWRSGHNIHPRLQCAQLGLLMRRKKSRLAFGWFSCYSLFAQFNRFSVVCSVLCGDFLRFPQRE